MRDERERSRSVVDVEQVFKLFRYFREGFEQLPVNKQRELLREIVHKVRVTEEGIRVLYYTSVDEDVLKIKNPAGTSPAGSDFSSAPPKNSSKIMEPSRIPVRAVSNLVETDVGFQLLDNTVVSFRGQQRATLAPHSTVDLLGSLGTFKDPERLYLAVCGDPLDFSLNIYNNMVVDKLSAVFSALSDPTRRLIIDRLTRGPATVNELAQPFAISQQAISKHLAYLERARLIKKNAEGRERFCRLRPEAIREISDWTEKYRKFWEESYARLDRLLEEVKADEASPSKKGK